MRSTAARVRDVALRVGIPVSLGLTLVVQAPGLASANLLPRRVALHLTAVLMLLAVRRVPVRRGGPWLVVAGALGLGWVASPFQVVAVDGALDALAALMLAAATSMASIPRRRVVSTVVVVVGVSSLVGLVEHFVPLPLGEATRPAGLLASRSTAGALAAATLPLLGAVHRNALHGAGAGLLAAFLISARARAGWAAALVGVLQARPERRVVVGALVGVLGAVVVFPGPEIHWRAEAPLVESLETAADALSWRAEVWERSLELFAQRPLLGVGPGGFEAAFGSKMSEAELAAGAVVESPHNALVRLVVEWGLVGVLAWAGVGVLARPRGRASPRTRALQASLVALGVTALFGKTVEDPPTLVVVAVMGGLLMRTRGGGGPRWAGPCLALVLAAIAVPEDVSALSDDRKVLLAHRSVQEGRIREAWEHLEPTLSRCRSVDRFRWSLDLVCGWGDARACEDVLALARNRFPDHRFSLVGGGTQER